MRIELRTPRDVSYKAYEELIQECRLRLEISTIDELSKEDQQHKIKLSFVPNSLQSFWSIGKQGGQPIVQIVTRWHVTNVPGSRSSAKLLEAHLPEPQGAIIQSAVHPIVTSAKQVHQEEIPEGETVKFTISFAVKLIPEPKSETLNVRIVIIDQFAEEHKLPPIALKRIG
jgi:hypothetical protein